MQRFLFVFTAALAIAVPARSADDHLAPASSKGRTIDYGSTEFHDHMVAWAKSQSVPIVQTGRSPYDVYSGYLGGWITKQDYEAFWSEARYFKKSSAEPEKYAKIRKELAQWVFDNKIQRNPVKAGFKTFYIGTIGTWTNLGGAAAITRKLAELTGDPEDKKMAEELGRRYRLFIAVAG